MEEVRKRAKRAKPRYVADDEQMGLAHINACVIDTTKLVAEYEGDKIYEKVCWCYSLEAAKTIARLLNLNHVVEETNANKEPRPREKRHSFLPRR